MKYEAYSYYMLMGVCIVGIWVGYLMFKDGDQRKDMLGAITGLVIGALSGVMLIHFIKLGIHTSFKFILM